MANEDTTASPSSEATTTEATPTSSTTEATATETTTSTKDDGAGTGDGKTILGEAKTDDKGDDTKAEANPLLGAPDGEYEIDKAALPADTAIDTEALAALAPIAKEIGLSNAGMSKLAGVYADKILPHVTKQIAGEIETQAATQAKDWANETRLAIEGGKDAAGKPIAPAATDKGEPVYGGLSYKEVTQVAARALDRLGTPELREFLETSGFGNNEALVRFAFRAGRAISEDTFDRGAGGESKPSTLQTALYGDKGA